MGRRAWTRTAQCCCLARAHWFAAPRVAGLLRTALRASDEASATCPPSPLPAPRRLQHDFAEARDAFEAHAAEQAARIGELEQMYRDRPSREEDVDRMR